MSGRIETTIDIDAAPSRVWQVLTDADRLPEWNPFVRSMAGTLEPGRRIRVELRQPGGKAMTFKPKVLVAEPGAELRWLGRVGLPGVFDGEHQFVLEPLDGGRRTRFIHAEDFRGVMVPFLGKMLDRTKSGFEAMNEALRERVERSSTPTTFNATAPPRTSR